MGKMLNGTPRDVGPQGHLALFVSIPSDLSRGAVVYLLLLDFITWDKFPFVAATSKRTLPCHVQP
jgi:hypothetical protein